MNTYISLLRGINVGGHAKIKMKDLTELYESMGFKNIKTYLQSGNVIFDTNLNDGSKIIAKIESKIKLQFALEVKTILRTLSEIRSVIKNNPFIKRTGTNINRLHVSFLSEKPDPGLIKDLKINKNPSEEFQIIGEEIYLYLPDGFGNAKLQAGIFEKKLHVKATARNWKTVNALAELAS